jgi:hypothetical protein
MPIAIPKPIYEAKAGVVHCCGEAISLDRAEAYLIAHRQAEASCLAAGDLMAREHDVARTLANELDATIHLAASQKIAAILTGLAGALDAVRAVLSGHLAELEDQHRAAGDNVIPFPARVAVPVQSSERI